MEDAGMRVIAYGDVRPDLPRADIQSAVQKLADEKIDVIIGLGGGSCMDFAKVMGILLQAPGDVRDIFGENVVSGPGLPVITVPTTGGTGAEATCISVVHDEDRGVKVGVASAYMEAVATVIDPEFTLTAPPGLTAATAADALSHLVESYTAYAKNPTSDDIRNHLYVGKNLLTDVWVEHGLKLIAQGIPALAENLSDLNARTEVMLAAFCGGMGINTTGTAGCHALQSPLSALTGTSHGFGVGALLPYVMRYNLPARVPEFARLGELIGADRGNTTLESAQYAVEQVEWLVSTIGAPTDLGALGMTETDVPDVAEAAAVSTRLIANNPRPLPAEVMEEILLRGVRADRSWWK
jgi:alcohol dehydrogenase class IV